MGMAKLPFHLSLLEHELISCAEDTKRITNRLIAFQEALGSCHKASKFFKQRKPAILLIGNPSVERTLNQRRLEDLDCIVEAANTVVDALTILNRGFDLVIFDLEEAGFKAATFLKQHQLKTMPKLVALSEATLKPLEVIGVRAIFKKPLNSLMVRNLLSQSISDLVDEERSHDDI